MPKTDSYEDELLVAYDSGQLKSVASKTELAQYRSAARAPAIKDQRVTLRLSSGDLNDIRVKALEEGHKWKQPMLWSFS